MHMKPYKNLEGHSGVIAYAIGEDFIAVKFTEGHVYLYNYEKPGRSAVEKMKQLALAGRGLSTYISREVREKFASKTM